MKAAGIVAEYNPFHKGHAYHIEQTRLAGATHIAAVMSGNFVQRGEPAIMLKHARAKAALAGGVDLVLELPLPWAIAGARTFAFGAVSLLNALGCVELLSFGSESGDAAALEETLEALSGENLNDLVRIKQKNGLSYASAREKAVRELFGEGPATPLRNPNDTLAVEYLRALKELGAPMRPLAVRRAGARHDEQTANGSFASASKIREDIRNGKPVGRYLPEASARVLLEETEKKRAPSSYTRLETAVLCSLRTQKAEGIAEAPDVSEGIENRIYEAAARAASLEEVFALAKTKRYSHARIRRVVLSSFLGVTAADASGSPPYIRVLGFNEKGRELLRTARETAALPVVMRASDIDGLGDRAKRIFDRECVSTDIYALSLPEPLPCGAEKTANVVF